MKKFAHLLAALLATTILPACGRAASSAAGNSAASTKPLTLVGLSIDETLPHAEASLRGQGYSLQEQHDGPSFEEAVARGVAQVTGANGDFEESKGVRTLHASKGGQHVTVNFDPSPEGGLVNYVSVDVPLAGHTLDEMKAETIARYGQPRQANIQSLMRWCTGNDPCIPTDQARLPYVAEQQSFNGETWSLTLEAGQVAEKAHRAIVDAAVRAKIGNVKPSF